MAKQRLKWMDYHQAYGGNAALTCRYFGVSRQTFYRWKRRYNPRDLTTLEERSHRPQQLRQPTWSPELAQAVLKLREHYPRWGKDKLAVLLGRAGWQVSVSMVGRILTALKARGVLREPPANGISARKRQRARPYAVRKPKEYQAKEPGDLVQVDTLDVRPLPGVVLKHFTARDVISRWDVLEVHTRATATTARAFLDTLQARFPFPLKAIQVDGGSEFQAEFEQACQERGLRLFVLPPRSPKLNGHVERANRTHTEEFYEVYPDDLEITPLNQGLKEWEWVYNHVRPHQSLGYLTPSEFLSKLPAPEQETSFTLSAKSYTPAKSRPATRQGAGMARGP
jgi:transposase InsO family protein